VRTPILATAALLALSLSACSLGGGGGQQASSGPGRVTLLTHDSFALSDGVLADFTRQTGIAVDLRTGGDAGALTNQLVLTKDAPVADVAYGVDNSFASRALEAGVFAPYTSPAASGGADQHAVPGSDALTAVDVSDVCVNIDTRYFAARGLPEPVTLDDLAKPEYAGLTEVENPATSSPGLAFLLATVAEYGPDGWQDYWTKLRGNGVAVADGWTQAYTVDFSGSSGGGPRPIVVSYASSPPAESVDGAAPPTKALLDTCFRQVEYAGVLTGAKNPTGAKALVDFLLSAEVQADVPGQIYVYPVQTGTPLPADWASYAPVPTAPLSVDPQQIADNRDAWTQTWRTIVQG
jgi:thiamine transport system substrate-binding protein